MATSSGASRGTDHPATRRFGYGIPRYLGSSRSGLVRLVDRRPLVGRRFPRTRRSVATLVSSNGRRRCTRCGFFGRSVDGRRRSLRSAASDYLLAELSDSLRMKSICSTPRALCRPVKVKWPNAPCGRPCCRLKARNSRLVRCKGWVNCSPKPNCFSVGAGRRSRDWPRPRRWNRKLRQHHREQSIDR